MAEFDAHVIPPGKAGGLLYRSRPYGQCGHVFSEKIEVYTDAQITEYLKTHIGLRRFVFEIFDQDGVGSCAAEATTQALQIARAYDGQPWVQLSPWSLYHESSGGSDRGSNIDDNLEIVRTKGVASMAVWPRTHSFRQELSAAALADRTLYRGDEWFDIASVAEFKTALLKEMPIVYGSFSHAKCAVQLLDESSFLYANSWASDWGDKGFGVEKFSNGINWGYGAWALRTASDAAV